MTHLYFLQYFSFFQFPQKKLNHVHFRLLQAFILQNFTLIKDLCIFDQKAFSYQLDHLLRKIKKSMLIAQYLKFNLNSYYFN